MTVFELLSLHVLVPRQFAVVCQSINMEWGVRENHVDEIALHNWEHSHSQIFKLLKPLKISWMYIFWAIKCYEELLRVEGRAQSGCLKSLRAEVAIKTMWERIHRNPVWKQKIMSRGLNIWTQSTSCIIRDDQHRIVHRRSKGHILTTALKVIRQTSRASREVKNVPRVQGGHHHSYVMVWRGCPSRGLHVLIFARKGWNWCPSV